MRENKFLIILTLTATMSLVSWQAFSFQAHEINQPTAQSNDSQYTISESNNTSSPSAPTATGTGLPPPPGTPGLPIDGFLGYFLVAGAIFGVRKLRKKRLAS